MTTADGRVLDPIPLAPPSPIPLKTGDVVEVNGQFFGVLNAVLASDKEGTVGGVLYLKALPRLPRFGEVWLHSQGGLVLVAFHPDVNAPRFTVIGTVPGAIARDDLWCPGAYWNKADPTTFAGFHELGEQFTFYAASPLAALKRLETKT